MPIDKAQEAAKAKAAAEAKLASTPSDQVELAEAIYDAIKKYKGSEKYFNLTLIDSGFYSFTPKKTDGSNYDEHVLVDFVTEEVFVVSKSTGICDILKALQTNQFDHKKDSKFTFSLKSNQEDLNQIEKTRSDERKKTLIELDKDRQQLIDKIEKLDSKTITDAPTESPLKDYNQKYQEYLDAQSEFETTLEQRFEDFKQSLIFLKSTESVSSASADAGGAVGGEGGGGGAVGGGGGDGSDDEEEKIKSKCQSRKNELNKKITAFKNELTAIDKGLLEKDLEDKIDKYDFFLDEASEYLTQESDKTLKDFLKEKSESAEEELKSAEEELKSAEEKNTKLKEATESMDPAEYSEDLIKEANKELENAEKVTSEKRSKLTELKKRLLGKDFDEIVKLVDDVKSMEKQALDYKQQTETRKEFLPYLASIAQTIIYHIEEISTEKKADSKESEKEPKEEEELLKSLSELLSKLKDQDTETEEEKKTETTKSSDLDELKKYFKKFYPEEESPAAEGGASAAPASAPAAPAAPASAPAAPASAPASGAAPASAPSSAAPASASSAPAAPASAPASGAAPAAEGGAQAAEGGTPEINDKTIEGFIEQFKQLKKFLETKTSSSSEVKQKLQEILDKIDQELEILEHCSKTQEKLEKFLNKYDQEDSVTKGSREELQKALKKLTDQKNKFDTTKISFLPSDGTKTIVDHTINELKYRYFQALESEPTLKLAIQKLKDKKDWKQALDPALFSDLETKFPVTDFLTIAEEIALITEPTEKLKEEITAREKISQETPKHTSESKTITKHIEQKHKEIQKLTHYSWQSEKIFKVDDALQIPLAVDFSADSCFTIEERKLTKPSDPSYQPQEKKFYQIQGNFLYEATTESDENKKTLKAVTDSTKLEEVYQYLTDELSLSKASKQKFDSIKTTPSGYYIALLRSDFIAKQHVKEDRYQKKYIKATHQELSLNGKEHPKSEFGSIHFIEKTTKSKDEEYIFGKCDISYSSFRGCKFENVDFTLMDRKVFKSLNFINCQFLNCKIPQSVNKAFTSDITKKEIEVPARTIEKATVSALLGSSKSP
jgi:hypothetical protein